MGSHRREPGAAPRLPILAPVRQTAAPRRTPLRANPGLQATATQPLGKRDLRPPTQDPRHHPQLRERRSPVSACCAPGHGVPRPFRGVAANRGSSRVGYTIRPCCRSLLHPGFIVCEPSGGGEGAAPPPPPPPLLLLRSLAHRSGRAEAGDWPQWCSRRAPGSPGAPLLSCT